jgi:hypothetical protein
MFLIKRNSDGKYWRNREYPTRTIWVSDRPSYEDDNWTTDINLCKPFASKRGAKSSFGKEQYVRVYNVKIPVDLEGTAFAIGKRRYVVRFVNRVYEIVPFESVYTIVEVELRIKK